MSRPRGSKNKRKRELSPGSLLTPQARILFLANAIIDKILEDQSSDRTIVKRIRSG